MALIIKEIDENNVRDNFDKVIAQGPSVARFHMDGCGHCTNMEPAWNETKSGLKDENVLAGAILNVNANSLPHIEHAFKNRVKGFPTILALDIKGVILDEFKGPRETAHLKNFCHKHLKKKATSRGGKRGGGKSKKRVGKSKKRVGKSKKRVGKSRKQRGGESTMGFGFKGLKIKKKKTGTGPVGKLLGAEEKEQYEIGGIKINKRKPRAESSGSSSSSCAIL
jgi:hypothetical protein